MEETVLNSMVGTTEKMSGDDSELIGGWDEESEVHGSKCLRRWYTTEEDVTFVTTNGEDVENSEMNELITSAPPMEVEVNVPEDSTTKISRPSLPRFDANNNVLSSSSGFHNEEKIVFPKSIAWDWPIRVARGVFTEEKFTMCLPFANGGTGKSNGSTKKFERINDSNFSWTIGLSSSGEFGTGFWRMELEIIRDLNMLAMIVSRDISRTNEPSKRLRRVRKVYRLPDYYDVRTLKSKSYDWAIVLEASPRVSNRRFRARQLRRADTLA
ncbi:hypothetical protein M3Y98_00265700 [Aphelenchoides besseyi]|nr:hypothetical protein M3Y98_00265700 [Aphelenchoides besseyi]